MGRVFLLLGAATVLAAPLACAPAGNLQGSETASFTLDARSPFYMVRVTDAPYSADEVSEQSQTLADETRIVSPRRTRRLFRDSKGRERIEGPFGSRPFPTGPPIITVIRDPVAGYAYVLDTENRVAHRCRLREGSAPARSPVVGAGAESGDTGRGIGGFPWGADSESPHGQDPRFRNPFEPFDSQPAPRYEPLGSRIIEGIAAKGRRATTVYRAGSVGNDRPITSITETWYSPDLKGDILSRSFDVRGERTTQLRNIRRGEPDPALFQVPSDYKIIDEQSTFTVTITRRIR